ncbi:MAG: dipeptide epimerase [Fimbriimonas ginsengisoli]|uniref:Dipeptide epimerase n=1 Tax=Fimbriimonas ginsengisoli TaxID=1005039 RepID=A0A931LUI7_FIMGI|nr:dipeptide epimerase [Fimbriimonas ginsengisoli]
MRATFRLLELQKLYPLTISRGTMSSSENLFVFLDDGARTGIGELSPATSSAWTAARGKQQLEGFCADWDLGGRAIHETYAEMRRREIDPPAMAALDVALWDLFGKRCGQPLYRVFGLPLPTEPTSVTIGINPPEVIRERVPEILRDCGAKCLKIKLGCPDGVERDKENFEAAREGARPFGARLRVDANGGWSVGDAKMMLAWLAERGVDYVEQPLPEGQEADLPRIFEGRPLPIFVDESCRFSQSVPKVAGAVDGVNLKLMKCGGLTEALRIVAAARAHGLQTMIGCMSESSVAIAAGAHIGGLFDHIDLDSHLNLNPDPANGAPIDLRGVIMPTDAPGHGSELVAVHA